MNRLEVLLEALKEADRHIEGLLKAGQTGSWPTSVSARARADEIEKAILAEKEPGNAACCPHDQRLEFEVQRLSDELHLVSAERDAARIELDKARAVAGGATQANPALENVLAKLRSYAENCSHHRKDDSLILTTDAHGATVTLTLGDLRRWVESEVKL
jgi:hypothetical protein